MMRERGYLPDRMPLLKRIAAVSGQRVCRFAHGVTIDGMLVGIARARDRAGRPLPAWFGCRTLRSGALFTMNPPAPDSFDGSSEERRVRKACVSSWRSGWAPYH